MASLASIQKQIAALEKRAASQRKTELASAVSKVKALMARHGLATEDLGLAGKARKAPAGKSAKAGRKAAGPKTPGAPKYQDPKTGKTWTGNGKAPGWIAGAKNRDSFLIQAAGAGAMPMAAAVAPPARRAKATPAAAPGKKAATKKAAAKPVVDEGTAGSGGANP